MSVEADLVFLHVRSCLYFHVSNILRNGGQENSINKAECTRSSWWLRIVRNFTSVPINMASSESEPFAVSLLYVEFIYKGSLSSSESYSLPSAASAGREPYHLMNCWIIHGGLFGYSSFLLYFYEPGAGLEPFDTISDSALAPHKRMNKVYTAI